MRRALAVAVLVAGWLLAGLAGAGPALAHATVVATDPSDGTRLTSAPARVTVTFSEQVTFSSGYLRVVDSKGRRVDSGPAEHPGQDGTKVSVGLRSGLTDDSYIVSYRVVSADSHPVGGAYSFVVGNGPLVAATGLVLGGTNDRVVGAAFDVTRWLSFAGLVLLGGLAFLLLCWPGGRAVPRARRLVWTGWGMSAAAAVLGVLLQGPYAAGSGLARVFSPSLLSATLNTTYGRMLCIRLILLGVLAVLALRLLSDESVLPDKTRSRDEDLTAIVGLGVLTTYGGTGHAAAGSQPTLALLSDAAHLAAVSVWVGGLVLLTACLLPTRRTEDLATALPRFSRIALGAVGVILVTGTYQSWREVGTIPALWSTGYGKLLLTKIACFLLLVGLGNLGRIAVRRRYLMPVAHALSTQDTVDTTPSEEDRMLSRLRRSVGLEVAIAAVVLAVTAVLVSTAPARASYTRPYSATLQLAVGGTAQLSVTPARQGLNTVHVYVFDPAGKLREAQEVTLTAALPAEQIGPLPLPLVKVGTGHYQSTTASLPRPGTWNLVVRVRTSEFDVSVAPADVPVR
jgi:copper transport protein